MKKMERDFFGKFDVFLFFDIYLRIFLQGPENGK